MSVSRAGISLVSAMGQGRREVISRSSFCEKHSCDGCRACEAESTLHAALLGTVLSL